MQDVFNQVWDVHVDVLPTSFVVSFTTPANPDGNVGSTPVLGIDLSGFTGAPAFSLINYSCAPAGSFACTSFGAGPHINSLSSSSTDFNVDFYALENGETYTFGAAVPEPSTWALMLLGFGGLGLATRARRRAIAAT